MDVYEPVKERIEDRARGILQEVGTAAENLGFRCSEVTEMHDEEFVWFISLVRGEKNAEVRFTLHQGELNGGGSAGEIAVGLEAVSDAELVGIWCPKNYTPEVWFPLEDEAETDASLALLDPTEVAHHIEAYFSGDPNRYTMRVD